jgi:hypothetical protein
MEKDMTKKTRVLIFMPTYEDDGIIQAFPDAVDCFYNLEIPDGYEADWVIGLDNPYGLEGRHANTLHQYQQIQRRVLDEGYDALVTYEHDMIVPPDGLAKLLEVDVPVVYGLYMLRHGAYCVNAFIKVEGNPNFRRSLTYYPNRFALAEKRGITEVGGVGMGFTLFRRSALERYNFHATGKSYAPDWGFALDCSLGGVKQMCRFDVRCGHIEDNGLIVYPSKEGIGDMVRVKILRRLVYGQIYEEGTICRVPADKVDDFLRAGYIQILGEPDTTAVKIVNKPSEKSTKAIKEKMSAKSLPERDKKGRFVSKED